MEGGGERKEREDTECEREGEREEGGEREFVVPLQYCLRSRFLLSNG